MNIQIIGKYRIGLEKRRNIRLCPEGIRVDSRKQMVHSRISAYTHAVDLVGLHAAGRAHGIDQRIDRLLNDRVLELFLPAFFPRFNNTVDHIRAKPDLSVPVVALARISPLSISMIRAETVVVPISTTRPSGPYRIIFSENIIDKNIFFVF